MLKLITQDNMEDSLVRDLKQLEEQLEVVQAELDSVKSKPMPIGRDLITNRMNSIQCLTNDACYIRARISSIYSRCWKEVNELKRKPRQLPAVFDYKRNMANHKLRADLAAKDRQRNNNRVDRTTPYRS